MPLDKISCLSKLHRHHKSPRSAHPLESHSLSTDQDSHYHPSVHGDVARCQESPGHSLPGSQSPNPTWNDSPFARAPHPLTYVANSEAPLEYAAFQRRANARPPPPMQLVPVAVREPGQASSQTSPPGRHDGSTAPAAHP